MPVAPSALWAGGRHCRPRLRSAMTLGVGALTSPPCYAFFIPALLRLIRTLMRFFPLALCGLLLSSVVFAESTRTWVQTKYEDYEKGTARGIAINSDGS